MCYLHLISEACYRPQCAPGLTVQCSRAPLLGGVFCFILLFLSVLGLRCYVQAFSSCDKRERGLLFVGMHGLLIAVASLVAECGLQWLQHYGLSSCGWRALEHGLSSSMRAQKLWCTGSVSQQHVESSWTKDQTCVPCIDRWIHYH